MDHIQRFTYDHEKNRRTRKSLHAWYIAKDTSEWLLRIVEDFGAPEEILVIHFAVPDSEDYPDLAVIDVVTKKVVWVDGARVPMSKLGDSIDEVMAWWQDHKKRIVTELNEFENELNYVVRELKEAK